jgi:hypothetical protein
MRLSDFGQQLDARVLGLSASLARQVGRRQVIGTILRGAGLAAAGLSLGTLATALNPREAEAHLNHCGGWWHIHGSTEPGSAQCAGCPSNGCPSGYLVCPSSTGCRNCTYTGGYWVAQNGLGRCGGGYRLCYDCHRSGSCTVCTCLSTILCTGCCLAEDVQESLRQQAAAAAAAS